MNDNLLLLYLFCPSEVPQNRKLGEETQAFGAHCLHVEFSCHMFTSWRAPSKWPLSSFCACSRLAYPLGRYRHGKAVKAPPPEPTQPRARPAAGSGHTQKPDLPQFLSCFLGTHEGVVCFVVISQIPQCFQCAKTPKWVSLFCRLISFGTSLKSPS